MNIQIKNCNNIDSAEVSITENKLNIKLAPNDTGKSTIAKAIELELKNDESGFFDLLPFKYRSENNEDKKPEISGMESIQNVMCFNEDYVRQFTFQKEELVSNSYEIFIKTESYKKIEQEIEALVSEIKSIFHDNEELEKLILTLRELSNAFKLTKTGLLKSSTGMKGLSSGNKVEHIPEGLEEYKPFIQSEKIVDWIDWQIKGNDFSEIAEACPFCTSNTSKKKEQIKKASQEYDKNIIKNLLGIINIIEKLGGYFSDDAKERLVLITGLRDEIKKEHEYFIVSIKKQIDNLIDNVESLRTLTGFHFKEDEKVSEKLPQYKLDLQFFKELDSKKMQEAIAPINQSLDDLIKKAGILQGKINIQRQEIHKIIEKNEKEINEFLIYAGYRYKVQIAGDGSDSKLKLLHLDHEKYVSGGNQHLSFGERNAFSIILFMYECLAKNPELIILDDPISSFDNNKKFAILEMLFRRDSASCFKNKTVLMLTHDVEPIIDTIKSLSTKFKDIVVASFFKLSAGVVTEQPINRNDIEVFPAICKKAIESGKDEIVKLIYLRRNYEIIEEKGDAYQVISNLLHKRDVLIDSREQSLQNDEHPEMDKDKILAGSIEIQKHLPDFSYTRILGRINDQSELKTLYESSDNGYEKLQLFRYFDAGMENSVIQKFINETYHIENEFICQLDPSRFDMIPEHVVEQCDKILSVSKCC